MGIKFTPGPWSAVSNNEGAISIMPEMMRRKGLVENVPSSFGFETGIGHAVCFIEGWTNDSANAALIAAAPDLLAALESMLKAYAPYADTTAQISGELSLHSAVVEARAAINRARGLP